MEFTYDGLVRHAFGFQNPNHAAAWFCLLLPWLWAAFIEWRWVAARVMIGAATLALLVMLVLTYSRTGMMVLLGEAALFAWLFRRERRRQSGTLQSPTTRKSIGLWAGMAAMLLIVIVAAVAFGAAGRFTGWITNPDRALTNRFSIWRGGVELFGANPFGVGLGNSGLLYTAFMVPEDSDIAVRSMVNGLLTITVEQGAAWSAVLLTTLLFAAWSGWRGRSGGTARVAALTALAGGTVSAMLSTCFDLSVLWHGRTMGFTMPQIGMAWLLCLTFVGTLAALWTWGWRGGLVRPGRTLTATVLFSSICVIVLFVSGRGLSGEGTPKAIWSEGVPFAAAHISSDIGSAAVVLYDDNAELPEMVRWARRWRPAESVYLPLMSWQWRTELPTLPVERIVLRGQCGYLAGQAGRRPVTLVSPPPELPRPATLDKLYLRRYGEHNPWPDLGDVDIVRY